MTLALFTASKDRISLTISADLDILCSGSSDFTACFAAVRISDLLFVVILVVKNWQKSLLFDKQ